MQDDGSADQPSVRETVEHYQIHLRRSLEHFLPDAILGPLDDDGPSRWDGSPARTTWRVVDRADEQALELHYLQRRHLVRPGLPRPFFAAERRLIEQILAVLDRRFRALFDGAMPDESAQSGRASPSCRAEHGRRA